METQENQPREEDFCPICGDDMFSGVDRHRCPKNVLAGIDAAHTNALRNDPNFASLHERVFAQRLYDGFAMLNQYGAEGR
ncbi:hypothetical protein CL614_07285 [archaeon]|nr:hypothetical protein [archaeon]|tara:strand:- start:2951 stop:3190 length:240 start_codon:yes stop_codon:yes gene_type:complete